MNNKNDAIEEMTFDYEEEDDCFEEVPGETIASFTFCDEAKKDMEAGNQPKVGQAVPELSANLSFMAPMSKEPYGPTPPIDGEYFLLSRTFKFRKSTVLKLNELKFLSKSENIYLSSIVDQAISNYYDEIKEKIGKQ